MKNDLFSIGPITVHGYGLMIAIGIIAAYLVALFRARKRGLNEDVVLDLVFYCAGFGFLGSKILYFLTRLGDFIKNPEMGISLASGWVVIGGIIGGIFGGWLCTRIKKVSFLEYFDLVLPAVALAQAFGRIGCLLAGCCYGEETTSALHIMFTQSQFAPNNVWLVPTQIYSSLLDFALFVVLSVIYSRRKEDEAGLVGGCYLVLYSIGRFILEFYRGDLVRGSIGVLSTSQFLSIFTALAGGIVIVMVKKKRKVA